MSILRTDGPGRFGPFGGQFVPETLMAPLSSIPYRPAVYVKVNET